MTGNGQVHEKDEMKVFEDEDIHFAFDKSILTTQDNDILSSKTSFLKTKTHPGITIRIEESVMNEALLNTIWRSAIEGLRPPGIT
jgi:hypothetical protein